MRRRGRCSTSTSLPPTSAARDAASAPSAAARRMPNSSTGRPRDASTTRAALVATSVAKLSWLSRRVSISCAAASGPSTAVMACSGGRRDPPVRHRGAARRGRASPNQSQKASSKSRPPLPRPVATQRLDVVGGRPRRGHPLGERPHPRRHAVARPGDRRSRGTCGRSARSGRAARAARSAGTAGPSSAGRRPC